MSAACALMLLGCGDEDGSTESPPTTALRSERPRPPAEPAELRVEPARCPAGAAECVTASGRIVLFERVDPDGDGDAHFVLLSEEAVTAPGISVIDVAPELRPRPLPEPGDLLSAAGPVHTGSYGQRQIEATEIRIRRID